MLLLRFFFFVFCFFFVLYENIEVLEGFGMILNLVDDFGLLIRVGYKNFEIWERVEIVQLQGLGLFG